MQEKLIIYLNANDLTHPSWVTLDAADIIRQSATADDSQHLNEIAADKKVIVIVPAEDILLLHIKLPKMKKARLKEALPYAVEEQLIDEVTDLHFALGEQDAEGNLAVAIVTKTKMDAWQALLKSFGVEADIMIPASLAFNLGDVWQIVVDNDIAFARTGVSAGFACDKNNLSLLLETFPESKPIIIHNYTKESCKINLTTDIKMTEYQYPQTQLITDLARDIDKISSFNLLQAHYKNKKTHVYQNRKFITFSLYGALAWIILLFLSPIVSIFILDTRLERDEKAINQIYQRNFPQAHSVVAPKLRMQEKLQNLNDEIGDSHLLRLLAYISKGLAEENNIHLQRFDFQNNQLTLNVMAASSEEMTAFTGFLTQQGLKVKQQNATLQDGKIKATLQVE